MPLKLYKIFKRTPFFLSASHFIKKKDKAIKSANNSRHAVIIPLLILQYGSLRDKFKAFKTLRPKLISSLKEMRKSAKELQQNPPAGKNQMDNQTRRELEDYVKSLGIDKLGYTTVNPKYIFKDFKILYRNAMIVAMEMKRPALRENYSNESANEIWRTYAELGISVNKIAHWLRKRGYRCHPSPAVGGDVMTVPIAQEAGLGVVGKHGLLITPEFGPSLRLAAVFIDVDNLPLKELKDNEHLWVRDFCETCNHCVQTCPGNAIYAQTKTLEDGEPQFIDLEKCAPAFSKNCSRCISSCPFFFGNYDKIKRTYFEHKKADRLADKTHISHYPNLIENLN